MVPESALHRPRVEGDREQEILEATLTVLADAGYDRLTMDAVAAEAKASKATLYRRWSSKPELVVDAVCSRKRAPEIPDTGTLRGDLIAAYCGLGDLGDARAMGVLSAVVTAMARDEEFAQTYRRDFIGPKQSAMRTVLERAAARGEISDDVDLDLIAPALPGIVLHRVFLLGDEATPELVARVVDQIILPAVTR
jgi:AcrR family transcriptional regulator